MFMRCCGSAGVERLRFGATIRRPRSGYSRASRRCGARAPRRRERPRPPLWCSRTLPTITSMRVTRSHHVTAGRRGRTSSSDRRGSSSACVGVVSFSGFPARPRSSKRSTLSGPHLPRVQQRHSRLVADVQRVVCVSSSATICRAPFRAASNRRSRHESIATIAASSRTHTASRGRTAVCQLCGGIRLPQSGAVAGLLRSLEVGGVRQ